MRSALASCTLAVALLAGCAPDVPETSPLPPPTAPTQDPSEKAAERAKKRAGKRLREGDGYWYVAPVGWGDATKRFAQQQGYLDSASQDGVPPPGGYADSVAIKVAPAVGQFGVMLPELSRLMARQLARYSTGVQRVRGKFRVDGHRAIKLVATPRYGSKPSMLEQYVTVAYGQVYVITFTLALSLDEAEHEAIVDGVLRSWHWG